LEAKKGKEIRYAQAGPEVNQESVLIPTPLLQNDFTQTAENIVSQENPLLCQLITHYQVTDLTCDKVLFLAIKDAAKIGPKSR